MIFKYEHIDLKGQNFESMRAMITEQAPPVLECLRDRLRNSGWKNTSEKETSLAELNKFEEVVNSPHFKNP